MEEDTRVGSGSSVKCMICGERYKTLYSHLRYKHNVSTEEYRAIFPDAPLFAETFQEQQKEAGELRSTSLPTTSRELDKARRWIRTHCSERLEDLVGLYKELLGFFGENNPEVGDKDLVACKVCAKKFKSLYPHLHAAHYCSAKHYRALFPGAPLTGRASYEKLCASLNSDPERGDDTFIAARVALREQDPEAVGKIVGLYQKILAEEGGPPLDVEMST